MTQGANATCWRIDGRHGFATASSRKICDPVLFVQLLNQQSESGKAKLSHAEIADRCSDRSWDLVRRKKQRPESRLLGLRA